MRSSTRKLVGVIVLLLLVVFYALAAMLVGAVILDGAPGWQRFAYYIVAGTLWALPGMLLIRWMQKPDEADAP